MFFDKKNATHLFALFIFLGAVTFMTSSYYFVRNQAFESAKIINEDNVKGEFSIVEQFVSDFIDSHQRDANKIAEYSYIARAVATGVDDPETLYDHIYLLKPDEVGSFINLYDFNSDSIYVEFVAGKAIQEFISNNIENGAMLTSPTYLFFKDNSIDYLLITQPIDYQGTARGVVSYFITLSESHLLDRLAADKHHWFGISQSTLAWSMPPPTGWEVHSKLIPTFSISLHYASSPEFLHDTANDLVNRLLLEMVLSICITVLLLYILGRKILVAPFQELARKELLLEKKTKKLIHKEAESTRLARVARYMKDGVVFTDPEINITWVNHAFEKLTGFEKKEVLGMNPGTLLQGPETDPATLLKIKELIKKREVGGFELVNYTKDKKAYWLEIQITPLLDNFALLEGFMAVQRDITDRKELQRSLQDSVQKAKAANTAKSQFLASMSHELRTPMNGVLGMSELIKESPLNAAQHQMVDTLLSSGNHMLSVLNDILDFSKIEAGKLNLSLTSFYISDFEHDINNMYSALCDEKGLRFKLTFCENKNHVCVADKTRIQQILQNLLNNAWKFTQQGEISASVKVLCNQDQPILEIIVSDTGIGIDKDKQELVFQPFSQAESDTTRKFGGTGLGLAIILELVNAMHGKVALESELGVGSQFKVTIPIKLGERRQDAQHKVSSLFDGSGLKVLIVEDNKINITVMSMFLKKRGFSTDTAEDGQQGVDKVQQSDYDLIIMDNHMPVMDGIDATKAIKALQLPNPPHIIGCTADAFEETRINMINAGCIDVVTKPIHSSRLDEVLIAIFKRNEQR